jgi:transposase
LEVQKERVCGLDVHKASVVACVLVPHKKKQVRTFGTTIGDLQELLGWLRSEEVTDLAMESTGSYWKPVYNVLEGQGIELLVVNPAHMKAVPGRKTDVKDAEWIAELLRYGLLRGSRIFERKQRELQELSRYQVRLIQARADELRRLLKVLEGGNIKASNLVTDMLGASGRDMLDAIVEGETDPGKLAAFARGRMKPKVAALERALAGSIEEHQRFMLRQVLRHIDFLDEEIATLGAEIEERMQRPFETAVALLVSIPGVNRAAAQRILAEIGADMDYWPDAEHMSSWAKICPSNNQSAGKRRSSSIGPGNNWLRTVLVQAAWSAVKVIGSRYARIYQSIVIRGGKKRAIIAVAHALLKTIYTMLREGTYYQEETRPVTSQEDQVNHWVRQLQKRGFDVELKPAVA